MVHSWGVPIDTFGEVTQLQQCRGNPRLCDDYDAHCNEFFFDRSPSAFRSIVTFLAAGKLRLLREMCALSFQEELLYWGVEEASLEWCCLRKPVLGRRSSEERLRQEEEEGWTWPHPIPVRRRQPLEGQRRGVWLGACTTLETWWRTLTPGFLERSLPASRWSLCPLRQLHCASSTMPDLREEEERVSVQPKHARLGLVWLFKLTFKLKSNLYILM